jgi:WD40 repeat protein
VTIKGHTEPVSGVTFLRDGKILASTGFSGGAVTTKFWDVASELYGSSFKSSSPGRHFIRFSGDGKRLVMVNADGTIEAWDTAKHEKEVIHTKQPEITYAAFSPDGKEMAIGHDDGTVSLFDSSTWQQTATFNMWGSAEERRSNYEYARTVRSIIFSPDGRVIVAVSFDRTLKIWDRATGRELATSPYQVEPGGGGVSTLFSPDGKLLATSSGDGTRIWNAATWQELAYLGKDTVARVLAFSGDGKILVSSGPDGKITLFDTNTWRELTSFSGNSANVVAISRDGQRLVTGSSDGTAKLWDVVTGQELATLSGNNGSVELVVFLPDGKSLAVGSRNGVVKLWPMATEDEIRVAHHENLCEGENRARWLASQQ